MINEFEVPIYMTETLPEIAAEIVLPEDKGSVYKNMQLLIRYTSSKIREHNYKAVKQCFALADKLYDRGNNVVRNAVENVYVFSFTSILGADMEERKHLFAIIPVSLYTLYINQLGKDAY